MEARGAKNQGACPNPGDNHGAAKKELIGPWSRPGTTSGGVRACRNVLPCVTELEH